MLKSKELSWHVLQGQNKHFNRYVYNLLFPKAACTDQLVWLNLAKTLVHCIAIDYFGLNGAISVIS